MFPTSCSVVMARVKFFSRILHKKKKKKKKIDVVE
jgi:hypothetical protein